LLFDQDGSEIARDIEPPTEPESQAPVKLPPELKRFRKIENAGA